MNKRRFLKNILVACAAPSLLLSSGVDRFKWKQSPQNLWIPNPEWIDAPYEISFAFERLPFYLVRTEIKPMRFDNIDGLYHAILNDTNKVCI